jgi:HNH endonuclease
MPFPPEVREQALVAAARHCCVCQRYKGVKVEVHHIVPESSGGTNDLDNAIVLCFDCHADAGHYNPRHPRGTKFSPAELRRARDRWHTIVQRNAIEPPDEIDALYCRYLICNNFGVFREITTGDFSRLPFDRPFVVLNDVYRFHLRLIERARTDPRPEHSRTRTFESWEAYSKAYPDVRLIERSGHSIYPYFQAIRMPLIEEVRTNVAPHDLTTRLLVEAGAPVREIAMAYAYTEECGMTGQPHEVYHTRPLWPLYLAVTNVKQNPMTLQAMTGESERPSELGYRYLAHRLSTDRVEVPLPAAALPAGATAVIPLATLVGPLDDVRFETMSEESQHFQEKHRDLEIPISQTVSHTDINGAHANAAVIGPAFWPRALRLVDAATTRLQETHEFDLANLYMIDRVWTIGSCPHLFAYESGRTSQRYVGELFAREAGVTQTHEFLAPPGMKTFAIVELEPEQTIIEKITVNGRVRIADVALSQGQSVNIEVGAGDRIVVVGRYETSVAAHQQPWLRNRLIRQYIEHTAMPLLS